MRCDDARGVVSGDLLPEEVGGDAVLRRHRRECASCTAVLGTFQAEEELLRRAILQEAVRNIQSGVGRRRRLRLLAGGVAGLAASLLVASLLSSRGPRGWTMDGVDPGDSWISSTRPRTLRIDGRVTACLQRGTLRTQGRNGLELLEGRLELDVTPGSGPFDVTTPAGVVGVRGTRFVVDVRKETEGNVMDRRFWLGLSAGVTTTVVVLTGKVLLTGAGAEAELSAGHVASMRAGQRPSLPLEAATRLLNAEKELGEAREGERKTVEQLASAKARAEELELLLDSLGRENGELQSRVQEGLKASRTRAEAQGTKSREEELSTLRNKLRVGEELPEEVGRWIGLDGGQRQAVNALLKEDGARLYAALRQCIAEETSTTAPTEDGPWVVAALTTSKAWMADIRKLQDLNGTNPGSGKEIYLEDVLGPSSPFVRMEERLAGARQTTLETARGVLSEEQYSKFSSLLGAMNYNFGGAQFSLSPNVHLRRPK